MAFDWGQGLKGAGGGALAGGSFGGPAGAVIGGGVGLLSGFFGNKENDNEQKSRDMLMDYYRNVQGRGQEQMGPAALGQTSDVRQRQLGLADHLTSISNGTGPSLATEQLKQATDRNVAQQASFANSGRGGAMGSMRAQNNSARLGATAAQDSAVARMAEANQARELLGLNLHGIRGADEQMSQFNAGQQNDNASQNMWARLKQMGMDDNTSMQIIQQLQGQNNAKANQPGLGDSVLAGGAGLFSLAATQRAQQKANGAT